GGGATAWSSEPESDIAEWSEDIFSSLVLISSFMDSSSSSPNPGGGGGGGILMPGGGGGCSVIVGTSCSEHRGNMALYNGCLS
ncbi:MAG: hypothetical protein CL995_04455, partial [Euryarchaeota archaeon]|nr:hypothetical protein [Euryarchaeota archaeon]